MMLRLIALYLFFMCTLFASAMNGRLDMLFSGVDQILDHQTFVAVGIFVSAAFWVNVVYCVISFFRNVVFLRNILSTLIVVVVFVFNLTAFAMSLYAATIDNLDMYLHIDEERIFAHFILILLLVFLNVTGFIKEKRGEKFQWTLKELGKKSRKEGLSQTTN